MTPKGVIVFSGLEMLQEGRTGAAFRTLTTCLSGARQY